MWIPGRRKNKSSRGEREDPAFSPFILMLAVAALALLCLLLYTLVSPILFGDDEPDYQIVPYGGEFTPTPSAFFPVPTLTPLPVPTAAPTLTPAPVVTFAPAITSGTLLPITANTARGLTVSAQMPGLSAGVTGIDFSPDGTRLAAGSLDGTVRVWDTASRRLIYTLTSASNRVSSVAFSADGTRLIAGGQDNVVRWWDMATGVELPALTGPTASVNSVAFSPASLIAAAASDDGRVYVWDLAADPGAVWLTLRGHTSFVTSVAFSPDGARIAAGGADRTIRVWTFASGAAGVSLTGHTSNITSVAFSPDGQRLASTSADHTARLWDAASGTPLIALTGHTENVNAAAFNPDGTLLATGSGGINDDRVLLWQVPDGALVNILASPGGVVNAVAFSPDGLRLAAGGATFLTMWTTTTALIPASPTPGIQVQNDAALIAPTAYPIIPSATFGPVPTAYISSTAQVCVLTVYTAGTLYAAPDDTSAEVGLLAMSQMMQAAGWTQGADGFTWWQLSNGTWARGDLFVTEAITLPDECWSLPPVDASAAPLLSAAGAAVTAVPAATTATTTTICTLTGLIDDSNLRTGPGVDYDLAGTLNAGDVVQATGWAQGSNGYTWWRLSTGAWIRADVVEFPTACQSLPYVGE